MTDSSLRVELHQRQPIPLDCGFTCAAGELLALVGPSGSGKTTVLRSIAGLLHPATGSVHCGDATWLDTALGIAWPPQARRVGLVFQHYALLPHLTVRQNVMLGVSDLPVSAQQQHASEWLARVHLEGLEQRRPGQLSGGQQQRVALARALARATGGEERADTAPGVLLLDEPFSAVDQVTRRKLRTEVARLRGELKIPIVMVTHDLDEARALADRVVVLHRGQALQAGPPEQVLNRPCTTAVARLVGLSNLFAGTVVMVAGAPYLQWGERRLAITDFFGFDPGDTVSWVIPAEGVLLHRPDRPTQGDAENPVTGTISEVLRLGSFTQLTLQIAGESQPLSFQVSSHAVERNNLRPGSSASVTLLAQHIHLMPAE